MFLTAQDFTIIPFNLTNLSENDSFATFVTQAEEKYLREVLGNLFYDAFITGLPAYTYSATVATVIGRQYAYGNDIWEALTITTGVTPVEGANWTLAEEDNRWLLLKNGANYDYENARYKWVGIKEMLKPLVHSLWMEANYIHMQNTGATIPAYQNGTYVHPIDRINKHWNLFQEAACGKYAGDYSFNVSDSLYGYLYVNAATYDDDVAPNFNSFRDYLIHCFSNPGRKNIFDL